ncbi:MAG: ANTAR domain-containing response regulator [Christensenellales bacterium]
MNSVLLVTSSEKSTSVFLDMLSNNPFEEIVTAQNGGMARRLMIQRDFDLCIINTPLTDEFGEALACAAAESGVSQVILIVKTELFDEVSAKVEEMGIFTIAKPINKNTFWSVLKLANAAYNRLRMLQKENQKLMQRIEDIRLVDRAKYTLIKYMSMTEDQAHKYIEKQAMDMRLTKKEVANRILKTYER